MVLLLVPKQIKQRLQAFDVFLGNVSLSQVFSEKLMKQKMANYDTLSSKDQGKETGTTHLMHND